MISVFFSIEKNITPCSDDAPFVPRNLLFVFDATAASGPGPHSRGF